MPCMGPSVNAQQAKQAYNDVLTLLKEKYGIFWMYPENMKKYSEAVLEDLKKSIYEVFLRDACETF